LFFFSSRRRHTRFSRDWSSDVCSSDLDPLGGGIVADTHLPLQPRTRCLLRFEHDLAGLAVLAFLWVVAGGELVIEAEEAAFLGRSEERRVGKEGRPGRAARQ